MKKPLKIVFVCSYYPPHTGGLENYVFNIASGLKKRFGWSIVVVTTDSSINSVTVKNEKGIKVYRLPVLFTLSNTPINPKWYFDLKKIFREERPDIVNAHAPVPFLTDIVPLILKDARFVLTYHDGSMLKEKSIFNIPIFLYEKILLRLTLEKAQTIICCSEYVRGVFLGGYNRKTVVINPGVEKIGKQKLNKKNKDILFVASLTMSQRHKGLDKLLNAFIKVKEAVSGARLIVVGSGDALTYYKKFTNDLGIQRFVIFRGRQYGNKLTKIFNSANVLVLPTTKESFGMVLIESLSQGTPVIGSNLGGIPDIISDNKNGFLVDPNNSDELASRIVYMLNNPKVSEKMGSRGIAIIKSNYLWVKQIEKTKETFMQTLK